ncbi:MAG: hypothetical protein O6761_06510 [Thaumarchaeota archaeon]|nr:hypothetical protein [Nitrososphaerota archaeon]
MVEEIEKLFELVTSDFAVGVIAVALVIAIGLSYYGAKRIEEN